MFKVEDSWNFPTLRWLNKYIENHKGFIAGGCFKQIFTDQKVKDIDIFFRNVEQYEQALKVFKEDSTYVSYYSSPKVEAFKDTNNGVVVELIKATFGSPAEILDVFDFTITKFAYFGDDSELGEFLQKSKTYKCTYSPVFFEHLSLKRLVTDNKILFPVSTFERLFRYAKYGYFPCRETKRRIITQLQKLPKSTDIALSFYDGLD